jgi:hypothetical protein
MPELSETTQAIPSFVKKNKFLIPAVVIGGGIGLFFLLRNGGNSVNGSNGVSTISGETPSGLEDGSAGNSPDTTGLEDLINELFNQNAEYQSIQDKRFSDMLENQSDFQSSIADMFGSIGGFSFGSMPGDTAYSGGGTGTSVYDQYSDVPLLDDTIPETTISDRIQGALYQTNQTLNPNGEGFLAQSSNQNFKGGNSSLGTRPIRPNTTDPSYADWKQSKITSGRQDAMNRLTNNTSKKGSDSPPPQTQIANPKKPTTPVVTRQMPVDNPAKKADVKGKK